jgi:hypothetical protein
VDAVSNESQNYLLEELGYKDVLDLASDLSLTGSPTYWYRSTPAGAPVVNTYPTSSDTIGVQFWAITPDITGGSSPASPDRYHLLIVDIAQQAAERDRGNHQNAQALQPEIDRQVNEMVEDLLVQQSAKYTRVTWASEDN